MRTLMKNPERALNASWHRERSAVGRMGLLCQTEYGYNAGILRRAGCHRWPARDADKPAGGVKAKGAFRLRKPGSEMLDRSEAYPGDFNRRDFLKLAAAGVGGLALGKRFALAPPAQFPNAERLGRVSVSKIDLRLRPDVGSESVGALYIDNVVPWLREVVGSHPYRFNQRWVETPEGYAWAPDIQPVRDEPNEPVSELPQTSLGPGMWAEVTVPHVDLVQSNPPARAPWLRNRVESGVPPRFVYSQIVWVDDIGTDSAGNTLYHLKERYGYGDAFWAAAEAFRPLTPSDLEPIRPEVENKQILVDINAQTLSCFEADLEVYFCRVSTGAMFNSSGERVPGWGTPPGKHRIWRKAVSLPLSGGSAAVGWDLPAVGWISLFVGNGVAIHSTYWHNDYGVPTSRGCVNARPQDAHWIFRWTTPVVGYDPGDMTVGMPGGTEIMVVEA